MVESPHLERAYELARAHFPHPNPRVGAVVVSDDGRVIGEGAHIGPGEPHAEVVALDQAGSGLGSTVYVSLEPCSHHGRTPPCVNRLIAEGVKRVVIGAHDPDLRVAGSGVEQLRTAGIEVDLVEDPAARSVDPAYFRHRETGLPSVLLKYATTLDGAVAAVDGSSRWISSSEARDDSHRLRAEVDAVVVGAGTLREDDPRLDVRIAGHRGHQPRPVVIAGSSPLPGDRQLWDRNPILVATTRVEPPAGEVLVVSGDELPDPEAACRALADAGYLDLLLEGGPTLAAAWWHAGLVTSGVAYVAASMAGGTGMTALAGVFSSVGDARPVTITSTEMVGPDARIEFEVRD